MHVNHRVILYIIFANVLLTQNPFQNSSLERNADIIVYVLFTFHTFAITGSDFQFNLFFKCFAKLRV